jgi:hypothetical protein
MRVRVAMIGMMLVRWVVVVDAVAKKEQNVRGLFHQMCKDIT